MKTSNHPLVISYYTPDTPYEAHAARLKRSVDRFGLASRIEPRPAKATWTENCAQKAQFVQDVRQDEKRPVLWIDADAVLRRPLHELDGCDADLAIVRRDGWSFYSGQALFGTGPGADRMMDIWCGYCRDFPHVYDQVSLGYAWWDAALETKLRTVWLDPNLSEKVSRRPSVRLLQRFISPSAVLHQQESRNSRSKIENDRFHNKMVPAWWRDAARRNAPFPIPPEKRVELGLTQ